ncbi:hypothetical protein Goshw_004533 [Gossypium schwendimanii]|uniref:DUF7745 domain-containing protein n=1 Tax=Gossypium schwendimanii TaxID=34291 RepID=A0A7J9N681_GOSSC|nr:hypothetical protein [Gossypium schwendimanii]
MEKGFFDKVEDNAAVRIWAETTQREKGDNLIEGHASELWDFTRVSYQGGQVFISSSCSILEPCLQLFHFWKSGLNTYCRGVYDLASVPRIQVNKVYSRATCVPPLLKKLMNITGMSEQRVAARIQQKGDSKCVLWKSLRDLVLIHPDVKKRADVFALGICGLVVFPKALGHIEKGVSDLFDRFSKGVTLVLTILAETFRSLNACQRAGEGRRDDVSEEKWMAILQNLHDEDVEWRAPWLILDEILYRCRNFDWVSLLRIWGAVGYAPLLVSRQFRSRPFIPVTQGLAQCEFSYREDNYKKKVGEMSNAWNQTHQMKILVVGPEHLQVLPSEIEIIKQEFEEKSWELGKKIEQLEEEKMQLELDVDIQRLEADKLRKGKNKAEEDLDSLKTDYKKLRRSIRTAGLGKTSEQWRQEI